jgi:hypothetical protein
MVVPHSHSATCTYQGWGGNNKPVGVAMATNNKHGHTEATTRTARTETIQTNKQTPWRQNPQVHHRIHNIPPPAPILSQLDPPYTPQPRAILIPFTPWSSKWSLSFWLSHQNFVNFPFRSYACCKSSPPHSPWLDLPNSICGWVQNMKVLTVGTKPAELWDTGTDRTQTGLHLDPRHYSTNCR